MYSEALLTGQNLSLSEALAMGGETTVIGLANSFRRTYHTYDSAFAFQGYIL